MTANSIQPSQTAVCILIPDKLGDDYSHSQADLLPDGVKFASNLKHRAFEHVLFISHFSYMLLQTPPRGHFR